MTRSELRTWAQKHASGEMRSSVAVAVLALFNEIDGRERIGDINRLQSERQMALVVCEHCPANDFGAIEDIISRGWDVTKSLSCTVCKKCRRRGDIGESGA